MSDRSSTRNLNSINGEVKPNLVVQTAFLGDLLLSIPMLKELKRISPKNPIVLLCRKGLGEPLIRLGLVDQVIEADKSSRESWRAAVAQLKAHSYNWIICPHESFRSATLVASLKAERKVGYARFFNLFTFSDRIKRPMALPEAIRQIALLQSFDSSIAPRLTDFQSRQDLPGGRNRQRELVDVPEWASMQIPRFAALKIHVRLNGELSALSSDRVREQTQRLDLNKPIAFLAPGSVWPTKMWTEEGYTQVARELISDGYQVALMGAKNEKHICDRIAQSAPGVVSFAGETSLAESFELLALADVVVCNDSGAMHMAAVCGIPTVSVFGPTVLDFGYRPWQNQAQVVEIDLPCRPCGSHGAKRCPIGTHACMKGIQSHLITSRIPPLMPIKKS